MIRLLRSLIVSLAMLPALAACGSATPEPPLPPSDASLAAIRPRPGVDREDLARRIDALFAKDAPGTTQALIVMRGGEIVAERYARGVGPETRFQGWSMSKTVTAMLVGLLVSEGRLRLDESAPIPNWQRSGDPRGEITVRQLLQMRSGLRHVEQADPPFDADTVRLLFMEGRDDMAAQAEAEPLEAEPGRMFKYSTASSIILSDIIARVLTDSREPAKRRAAVDAFLRERLLHPLGLKSMVAEYDAAGTMIGGSMIWGNARDWGRFGEFMRHYGSVKGAQIVPRRWIEFMLKSSPRAPDYGAHVWLNKRSGGDRSVLFADRGPGNAFSLVGHLGQYVIVVPDQKLTIVRLGLTQEEDRAALVDLLAEIVALYRNP